MAMVRQRFCLLQLGHPAHGTLKVAILSNHPFQLQIQTNGSGAPQTQMVSFPERLVVDIPNTLPGPALRGITIRRGEVRGIRVAEDVFWIHIRDAGGTVHALKKSELKSVDRELEASLMPSYATRLKDAEIDDLVAYLSTLRGAK